MKKSTPTNSPKVFRSISLQLAAALLTDISEATFIGLENNTLEKDRKVILIAYPESAELGFKRVLDEFESKTLCVNLFYYNRNLNFLRDRIFNRKVDRKIG
ncbi:MAG: hypothetical protein PHG87_01515 [Candidatus Omnitrophica bacterium]|nr:hypothetical protein [Candidatus Omnitrophota bacterium]